MKIESAVFELSVGIGSQLPACDVPEIAVSGRSNVGKSSLINRLLGRKSLARTGATPGKTVTVNFYRVDGFRLVDLPGYGYAARSLAERRRYSAAIGDYLGADRDLRLVLQLVDMRHPPTANDLQMLDFLVETACPFLVVLTKADKLSRTERAARLAALPAELSAYEGVTVIPFSSVTGEGCDQLRTVIDELVLSSS